MPSGKVIGHATRSGIGLHPLAVLPVAAALGDLADVDLGIEVGGKGLAVVAGVAVDDVQLVDLVEEVLLGVGAVDVGHAGIENRAEQRHEGLLEAVPIGPLPFVFELGLVRRLVVGGVEVVDPGLEAGVHEGQVLVGQGDVEHQVRLERLDQGHGLGDVVGIKGGCLAMVRRCVP
jgi:hypothetical protein